jgi:hypothetical protein
MTERTVNGHRRLLKGALDSRELATGAAMPIAVRLDASFVYQ